MINPHISIIIPTYNRAHCIADTVNNILEQTYPYFELIIVDDCSTDNTHEIINSYNDNRIKYVKNDKNMGPSASRNYGITIAQHDYIAFQDSDDLWDNTKLEKQINVLLSSQNNAKVVYTQMLCKNEQLDNSYIPLPDTPINQLSGNIQPYLLVQNFIGAPTIMLHKSVVENVGNFREDMRALEDWELMLRISKEYYIEYINEPLHIYNLALQNNVSSNFVAFLESKIKILSIHKEAYLEHNLFNSFAENILLTAQKRGVLEQTYQMMSILLQSI